MSKRTFEEDIERILDLKLNNLPFRDEVVEVAEYHKVDIPEVLSALAIAQADRENGM